MQIGDYIKFDRGVWNVDEVQELSRFGLVLGREQLRR